MKLKMDFIIMLKVEEEMEELQTLKLLRNKIVKMKENEKEGFSSENLDKCRKILNPYLIGQKKISNRKPLFQK